MIGVSVGIRKNRKIISVPIVNPNDWILISGFWNDLNSWNDSANWID